MKYHVVWCPKYRRRVLGGAAEWRLKQIIGEVVAEFGGMVIEVETMPDHVHLAVELPPQVVVKEVNSALDVLAAAPSEDRAAAWRSTTRP